MQVILLHDVDRLGHEGDVLTVADGYARNYLLPQALAVKADRGTLKDLETRQHAIERRNTEKRAAAVASAEDLGGKLVTVKATTGQGTKLHGTVTTAQIAEAASQQLGITLDRRDIDIAEPIRETGDYLVSVRLYKDVAAQLPLHVISSKSAEELAEEAAAAEAEATAKAEAEAAAAAAAAEAEAEAAEAFAALEAENAANEADATE